MLHRQLLHSTDASSPALALISSPSLAHLPRGLLLFDSQEEFSAKFLPSLLKTFGSHYPEPSPYTGIFIFIVCDSFIFFPRFIREHPEEAGSAYLEMASIMIPKSATCYDTLMVSRDSFSHGFLSPLISSD